MNEDGSPQKAVKGVQQFYYQRSNYFTFWLWKMVMQKPPIGAKSVKWCGGKKKLVESAWSTKRLYLAMDGWDDDSIWRTFSVLSMDITGFMQWDHKEEKNWFIIEKNRSSRVAPEPTELQKRQKDKKFNAEPTTTICSGTDEEFERFW